MSIRPMLKVSLVAREQDRYVLMAALQAMGVLHITPLEHGKLYQIEEELLAKTHEHLRLLNKALSYLGQCEGFSRKVLPPKSTNINDAAKGVFSLLDSLEEADRQIKQLEDNLQLWSHFGQFKHSPAELAKVSIVLKLAKLKLSELESIKSRACFVEVIKQDGDDYYVAIFLTDHKDLGLKFIEQPARPLACYQQELDKIREKKRLILLEMASWYYQIPSFEKLKNKAIEECERLQELDKAKHKYGLLGLSGYVLSDQANLLAKALDNLPVAVRLSRPELNSLVPVKLSNPRAIRGFEAISRAFSGVNYFEKDKTGLIAVLFVIFGSLCLLDAGYGLLLFLSGYLVYHKKNRDFGQVFMWTGLFSSILGLLSGQLFGLVFAKDILLNIPPLLSLATDPLVCFQFSLAIGLAVMALTNLVCVYQNGFNTNALGNLLALIAGAVLAVEHSGVLYDPWIDYSLLLKNSAWVLLALSLIAWLAFPDPVFGADQRVANICWTIYSGPVGLIQDILSHMRLFGIALSGSILALVINKISGMMPVMFGALFAPLGHLAVFLLSLLSLYIHTNRLIFLEFGSKCMSGGHHYFSPLGRKN